VAEKSGISWTRSTFNPWIGCTKVSPGCDACYAEALDARHRWKDATHWGPGVLRMRTSPSNWKQPEAWNRKAAASVERWLVFCASLADVFDNEVPEAWRADLWRLIRATPALTWLLLTKRIGNAAKMHPGGDYPNVWLGASVVNQEEVDRDIQKLLATPAALRFVSYEPALGPVDWRDPPNDMGEPRFSYLERVDGTGPRIDWIIVGGESNQGGAQARSFEMPWALSTIKQCRAAGVPVFVKQLGSNCITSSPYPGEAPFHHRFKDRAGADPAEWPEDLRVQEFPA
jgi:protein gp37